GTRHPGSRVRVSPGPGSGWLQEHPTRPEPNTSLQLQLPHARSGAGGPGWRQVEGDPHSRSHDMLRAPASTTTLSVASPGVYDPIFEQFLGSHLIPSFGLGTQASSDDLAPVSYATLSHTLQSDPLSLYAGPCVYHHIGFGQSLHFAQNFCPGNEESTLEFSTLAPPYPTLNPRIWQGDPYPPQWTRYQTVTDSESFNAYTFHQSMASHSEPISSQDNYTAGGLEYENS
ncbi:hypothetical protein F5878DRAFT_151184, partial [Lentinula raphanica]